MIKYISITLMAVLLLSCSNKVEDNATLVLTDYSEVVKFENNNENETKENNMDILKLYIDDVEVEVQWEDNESVKQISNLAKKNPIIINSHQYGGFEQVGDIGQNIVSNDIQMTTEPGDIVLYAGNNIVVFFGSNSWAYTKLGKINKEKEEIKNLLNKERVTLKIE